MDPKPTAEAVATAVTALVLVFISQVDDSIKLLLSCAAGHRFLGRGAVEMDAELVAQALSRGFGGMNLIFDEHGFPQSDLEAMSRGLLEVLEQAGME